MVVRPVCRGETRQLLSHLFRTYLGASLSVTSDSDFTCLCRKLRERGATVCIVGEARTPEALRNAGDFPALMAVAHPDHFARG